MSSNAAQRAGRRIAAAIPSYALLIATAAALLLPLYLLFVFSLHGLNDLLKRPPELWENPFDWGIGEAGWGNWDSYKIALTDIPMPRYMLNSFAMAGIITVGQVLTSALAAYAFAFLRFPFRTPLFFLFLATMMVPWEASIIPNFETIQRLDWIDDPYYRGLTAPFLATAFGTFLLRQHFLTIPQELKDAADIDGYGHLRFLVFVVVPLSRAALATLAVFAFLQAWNQYLWPLLVTNDPDMRTVQIGIKALETSEIGRANAVLAATIIAFLPMLVLVIAFQRFLVRGLTAGAVKG